MCMCGSKSLQELKVFRKIFPKLACILCHEYSQNKNAVNANECDVHLRTFRLISNLFFGKKDVFILPRGSFCIRYFFKSIVLYL